MIFGVLAFFFVITVLFGAVFGGSDAKSLAAYAVGALIGCLIAYGMHQHSAARHAPLIAQGVR
ncbi:MAG: hypothetical protein WAN43_01195 [Rhodomicrobium sp.]|jgi:hypothetical protein